MYYGFHFKSDAGVEVQFRINSANQNIYCRTSPSGGEWSKWRRLDAGRDASGNLQGTVEESVRAQKADKLSDPMRITFFGEVSGQATFDGSEDVSCNLVMNTDRILALITPIVESAIAKHVAEFHYVPDNPGDSS